MSMPTYHITIADKIKAYRNENNLSLKEFGKLIGVSAQAVSKWELDKTMPDSFLLPRLADVFGCSIDDLFDYTPGNKAFVENESQPQVD